jgi:hypothetical protein
MQSSPLVCYCHSSQPGPSRVAPPTPTSEDTTPLIPTDHTRTVANSHTSYQQQHGTAANLGKTLREMWVRKLTSVWYLLLPVPVPLQLLFSLFFSSSSCTTSTCSIISVVYGSMDRRPWITSAFLCSPRVSMLMCEENADCLFILYWPRVPLLWQCVCGCSWPSVNIFSVQIPPPWR